MKGFTCPKCDEYFVPAKRKQELKAQPQDKCDLHTLISTMYDAQHMRIMFENRFKMTNELRYGRLAEQIAKVESYIKDDAEKQLHHYPISEWIVAQKGISYDMAAQMIGLIQDIGKFDNISSLWSYAGMGVIKVCQECGKKYLELKDRPAYIQKTAGRLQEQYDKKIVKEGKSDFKAKAAEMLCSCEHPKPKSVGQKKLTGTLLDYNPKLKSLSWRFGKQFIMQGDFYRGLYEQFRAEYELRDDLIEEMNGKSRKVTKHGTSKGTGHIHNMASRKMVKIFLSHLWLKWRECDGLPVSDPWIIAIGGHSKMIAPPEIKPKD